MLSEQENDLRRAIRVSVAGIAVSKRQVDEIEAAVFHAIFRLVAPPNNPPAPACCEPAGSGSAVDAAAQALKDAGSAMYASRSPALVAAAEWLAAYRQEATK